jgi:hypothetical protein
MNDKAAIKSKTIITNSTILAIIPILTAFGVTISPDIQAALLGLVPLMNILLRMVTKGGITSAK